MVPLVDRAAPVPPQAPARGWHVLILTNAARSHLFTITAEDVAGAVHRCRTPVMAGYAQAHGLDRLVHVESFACRHTARARMMRIRGWPVAERRALIERQNPDWRDLAEDPPAGAMAPNPEGSGAGLQP